jgi:hypothetical protein
MKLSEAIRLGALLRHQAFGSYFSNEGSCALGAAAEAIGCTVRLKEHAVALTLRSSFPLYDSPVAIICPDCQNSYESCVSEIVAHFNDEHYWTRERIADWVETREQLETQETNAFRVAELCS